jgi:hypothetical protein
MEQAIRQVITAAVHRVKSKEYEVTPEDPVQTFLDDLFAELFPVVPSHTETQSVEVPVVAVKEKKQRKKKEAPAVNGDSDQHEQINASTASTKEESKHHE